MCKQDDALDCNLITLSVCQMSEWIAHSKDLFMQSLAEVGQNHQHALDLQTQHQHFTANCMVSMYNHFYEAIPFFRGVH